jgi:hypothetical protein
MHCPILLPTLVIADDAKLAARVSCVLAKPGAYVPVIDGPRLTRPDREAEVIRRNNAAGRVKPSEIILAGLAEASFDALNRGLAPRLRAMCRRISTPDEADPLSLGRPSLKGAPLIWGSDRIGIGLLRALRSGSSIVFEDCASPIEDVPSKSGHLVICEDGEELTQVIAANYAYALRAGLCLIPEVPDPTSEKLREALYGVYEQRDISPTEALIAVKQQLRSLCGPLSIPPNGSVTFVTSGLPFGFAYPEAPSTHLFTYPDLGIAVINGLAAEQPRTRGIGVAVLVDPQKTEAPEIAAAEKLMPPRHILLRLYRGPGATVRSITEMIELLPFDLLFIATHCGDSSGYRWTYKFTDSEGLDRELVVDIAVGFARTDDENMLAVTQLIRFISLDGVDWNDPLKSEKLHVGTAIIDFSERTRPDASEELKPVTKTTVPRVTWSAVLQMHDHNFLAMPKPVAADGTPIIINNACASWHQLAETFTFGNARAYIGTLFDITTSEAHDIAVNLLDKRFGKPLPAALWSAQREVYGDSVRRPYVMTGVYPQRLRVSSHDVLRRLASRLSGALNRWRAMLREVDPHDDRRRATISEKVKFYEREMDAIRRQFGP